MSKSAHSIILYGRRVTNSRELMDVQIAVMGDLLAGKVSMKEANAVNRDSRKILKMFKAKGRRQCP